MDIQEVADKLNGVQYRSEGKILTLEYCKELKEHGIVVVYGASDDLMEMDGAVSDEFGAEIVYFTKEGVLVNECDDYECPYFEKLVNYAAEVEPRWCDHPDYSWTYLTRVPHVTFDVMEDDEKYCRGIVFRLADVP